jgi:hypothetical protein
MQFNEMRVTSGHDRDRHVVNRLTRVNRSCALGILWHMKRTSGLLAFALLAIAAKAHAETRNVGSFDGVEIAGLAAMDVKVGSAISVDVQGDPEAVKLVRTTVKNGSLVVETPKDFAKRMGKKLEKLKVLVTMPAMNRVAISGTGSIQVEGIAAKALNASISGTGALKLVGKVDKLNLAVEGTAEIAAKKLVAEDVAVSVNGTAKASLHASRSLDADVAGTAMMKVAGNPQHVHKNVSGTAMIDTK